MASYPAEVAWRPWAEGPPAEGGPAAASRGRGALQILAAAEAAAWACLLAAVVRPSGTHLNLSAVIHSEHLAASTASCPQAHQHWSYTKKQAMRGTDRMQGKMLGQICVCKEGYQDS